MSLRRRAALACALLLPACGREGGNPFAERGALRPVRAEHDIVFTTALHNVGPGRREVYAVADDGSSLTRLTACGTSAACDVVEAAPAPDRQRLAVRRTVDGDGDGRLGAADPTELAFFDVSRGLELRLFPPASPAPGGSLSASPQLPVTGVDWAPDGGFLVFSAGGAGGRDDLWISEPNGTGIANRSGTSEVHERRARVDLSGRAAYARIDATGKAQIHLYPAVTLTTGGICPAACDPLPGSGYVVGSDTDPAFSPDSRFLVFRRLTAVTPDGRGTWDLMRIGLDGSGLTAIASGPVFRGAPDWGAGGIVFNEIDAAGSRLVVVQGDGTGRRVIATAGRDFELTHPRWLTSP